jgi:hypothetical protein
VVYNTVTPFFSSFLIKVAYLEACTEDVCFNFICWDIELVAEVRTFSLNEMWASVACLKFVWSVWSLNFCREKNFVHWIEFFGFVFVHL